MNQTTERRKISLQLAAANAVACQDACNASGIARSMVEAMDAIREIPSNGTRQVNTHPIVFMYLYKLMALNGHEMVTELWDAYQIAEAQCIAIATNDGVTVAPNETN